MFYKIVRAGEFRVVRCRPSARPRPTSSHWPLSRRRRLSDKIFRVDEFHVVRRCLFVRPLPASSYPLLPRRCSSTRIHSRARHGGEGLMGEAPRGPAGRFEALLETAHRSGNASKVVCLFFKASKKERCWLCCEEALRTRHEVVPNAQYHRESFHLFATSFGYMPRFGATATRWVTYATCTG